MSYNIEKQLLGTNIGEKVEQAEDAPGQAIMSDVIKLGNDAFKAHLASLRIEADGYGIAVWAFNHFETALTAKYGTKNVIFNDVKALMNDSLALVKPTLITIQL
jgi:hypothetical protein